MPIAKQTDKQSGATTSYLGLRGTFKPKVTIGLIVRNGEATIARALQSLLNQEFRNFIIIVGDNASTDSTPEIIAKFAAQDTRVTYMRHTHDLGIMGNTLAVLHAAETPYFMWAAADDQWANGFLTRVEEVLSANPSAVSCQSRVLFCKDEQPTRMSIGTGEISGQPRQRVQKFLQQPNDNSRFYGLFRTDKLKQSVPHKPFYAMDWAISASSLAKGAQLEVAEILMVREETSADHYPKSVGTLNSGRIEKLFPLFPLTKWLQQKLPNDVLSQSRMTLFWLNIKITIRFFAYRLAKFGMLHSVLKPGFTDRLRRATGRKNLGKFNLPKTTNLKEGRLLIVPIENNLESFLTLVTALNGKNVFDWQVIAVDRYCKDAARICLERHNAIAYVAVDSEMSFGSAILKGIELSPGHIDRAIIAHLEANETQSALDILAGRIEDFSKTGKEKIACAKIAALPTKLTYQQQASLARQENMNEVKIYSIKDITPRSN